jgi:hypothetical protein
MIKLVQQSSIVSQQSEAVEELLRGGGGGEEGVGVIRDRIKKELRSCLRVQRGLSVTDGDEIEVDKMKVVKMGGENASSEVKVKMEVDTR